MLRAVKGSSRKEVVNLINQSELLLQSTLNGDGKAVDEYVRVEELPSGHGYADVVFIPKKGSAKPAMLIEIKWDESVDVAIAQIKDRNYPRVLEESGTGYLIVGITYNSRTKEHACFIEKQKLL